MIASNGLIDAQLPKVDGLDRIIPASETLLNVAEVAESLGVTRLANITGLDRVGIPVYAAVVPKSDDILSVYNGKGRRLIDAKVGALMEAIERQTALKARLPMTKGSFAELSQSRNVLDPRSINQEISEDYSEHTLYDWVQGIDIVTNDSILVPADLAGYRWNAFLSRSCFARNDANGLASGNCRDEAVCHALCELAERDAWTMAEIGAHQLPRARRSLAVGESARNGSDDLELFPTLNADDDELVQKFYEAGLFPVIHAITSEIGVPTIIASVADQYVPGFPMVHGGLGAHPNAYVALTRALTELAQSRCVDIQGVREDIKLPTLDSTGRHTHTQRVRAIDWTTWYLGQSRTRLEMAEIPSHKFPTIKEDLGFLIDRFTSNGLNQIIVIEFPSRSKTCSVVRVIVPGVEFWATGQKRLGPRAVAFWKKHA
jgi:ribosomal protein S12 methylthiotransferase accessory factor